MHFNAYTTFCPVGPLKNMSNTPPIFYKSFFRLQGTIELNHSEYQSTERWICYKGFSYDIACNMQKGTLGHLRKMPSRIRDDTLRLHRILR